MEGHYIFLNAVLGGRHAELGQSLPHVWMWTCMWKWSFKIHGSHPPITRSWKLLFSDGFMMTLWHMRGYLC